MGASNVKRREHLVGEEIASSVWEDLLQFYLVEGGWGVGGGWGVDPPNHFPLLRARPEMFVIYGTGLD